ncbi:MAG: hypothetical protein AAB699_00440 [Patescibacteria group bacterium]
MTFLRSLFLFCVITVVEMFPVSAQLASLPIGSTNAVLEDAVRQVNGFSMDVRLLSKDELSVEEFLADEYSPSTSPSVGETTEVVRARLAALIKSVNFNKLEYAGRAFLTTYGGWRYLPDREHATKAYLLLGTDNWFTLEKNEKGELVAPKSAYTVDLTAALMRIGDHIFFVESVGRVLLEAEDDEGNVVLTLDSSSRDKYSYVEVVDILPPDGFFIPKKRAVSGQRGRVSVWYKNGAKRVYRLKDGTLFPQLEIAQKSKGLLLTVLGTDSFVIEFSQDLMNWESSYTLVPLSDSPPRRFLEKNPNGKGFYRLRVTEPAGQRR